MMGGKKRDGDHGQGDVYSFPDNSGSSDSESNTSLLYRRRNRNDDPEAMKLRRVKLNNDVAKELGVEADGKFPLNVAIIGTSGVGKSSCLNTLITSMTNDRYREYVITGMFDSGIQMTYLTKSVPKSKYQVPAHADVCYPNLIDIAGFEDMDNELNEELLRIIFYGRLPVEDSLKAAADHYKEHGMKGLREKYSQNLELMKVDRIVIVASAEQNIPENLISCVTRAARPSGSKAGRGKMTIPVFGILTKVDSVDLESSEFLDRENKFLGCVGLKGAKQRYTRLVNYCSDVDKKDERLERFLPQIDIPSLNEAIPVFGILTKVDSVDLESSEFLDRENKFLGCVGLKGAKQRYTRLVNYCSDVDKKDERLERFLPQIDIPSLKFLKELVNQVYEVEACSGVYTDIFLKPSKKPPPVETIPAPAPGEQPEHAPGCAVGGFQPLSLLMTTTYPNVLVMYAVKWILIVIFVYICLAPTISSKELLSICTSYDRHTSQSLNSGFHDEHLSRICDRKFDIIGRSLFVPLMIFFILIVLADFFLLSLVQKIMDKSKPKRD